VYPNIREILTKPENDLTWSEGKNLADLITSKRLHLPAVNTFRFGSPGEVGGMQATTDWLGALFQTPYKVEVVGKPYAVGPHYSDPYIFGSWDIGDVKLSLVKPVHDIGVYLDGHVQTEDTNLEEWDGYFSDSEATAECGSFMIEAHLRNEANVPYTITKLPNKGLLLYFRTPRAVDISRAQVARTVTNLKKPPKDSKSTGRAIDPYYSKLIQYSVTLSGDASPDFVVIEVWGSADDIPGTRPGDAGQGRPVARHYFVNIGGDWKLMESDSLQGCS
jgi:hypothetical protein